MRRTQNGNRYRFRSCVLAVVSLAYFALDENNVFFSHAVEILSLIDLGIYNYKMIVKPRWFLVSSSAGV